MGRKVIFLVVCFSLIFSGCSNDDGQNFHFTALQIISADVPESFELNQTYQINVTYSLPDGCTAYEGFDVNYEDTTIRNVVAIGSVRTNTEACEEVVTEGQAFFNFTIIYDQPYTFKFFQGENNDGEPEFLEIIVPVN